MWQPAALEDTFEAWQWFATQGVSRWGLDANKLAVGGCSAGESWQFLPLPRLDVELGGGIALSLALYNRDMKGPEMAAICLDIPYVSARKDWSMTNIKFDKVWGAASVAYSASVYTPEGTSDPHKYAWPIEHASFKDLPPIQVNVAELDVLRDAGIEIATRMMRESSRGVEVRLSFKASKRKLTLSQLHVWKGAFHGSDGYLPFANISRLQWDAEVSFLSRELNLPRAGR